MDFLVTKEVYKIIMIKKKLKESYDEFVSEECLPIIIDIFEHNDFDNSFEFYDTPKVETTDGSSYSGFASFTEGTVRKEGYLLLSHLVGTGISFNDRKVKKRVEELTDNAYNDSRDDFIKDNKKDLEELFVDGKIDPTKINYNDLYDMDADDLAEDLSEREMEYMDYPIAVSVRTYFKKKDDSYNCYIFAEVTFDEYARAGSGIITFEDEFDFTTTEELGRKSPNLIKKAFKSI
jgi:hypothetical protein